MGLRENRIIYGKVLLSKKLLAVTMLIEELSTKTISGIQKAIKEDPIGWFTPSMSNTAF